jgi:hypothetical protein
VLDTQIPGETGVFFRRQSPESLQAALLNARRISWNYQKIHDHAVNQFSETAFFTKVEHAIDQVC